MIAKASIRTASEGDLNHFRIVNRAPGARQKYALFLLLISLTLGIGSCTFGAPPTPTPFPTATAALSPSFNAPTSPSTPLPNASPTSAPTRAPSPTLAPTLTRTRSAKNIELLSRLGGTYGAAVAIAGSHVYLSVGARLVVLDVGNGQHVPVGQSAILPSYITSISVTNGYAYVTTESAGVSVFNISVPKQPILVGTLSDVKAQRLVLAGDYAYAVDETSFKVYRVTDPIHWVLASSIAFDGAIKRLAVLGQYAYVTGTALHIVDVSNPSHAQELGRYTGMENATDLAIIGNYAWVLTGYLWHGRTPTGELHVIDISNPAKPAKVNVLQFNQPTQRLLVANGFAYVGAYEDLHVFSTANPKSPTPVTTYRASGYIADLATLGTALLIASSDGDSLRAISIARPERLGDLWSFYTPKGANQVAVAGRYAYIADHRYGFLVMDIAEPRAPVIVGEATEFFEGWDLALAGNYLYVSSGDSLRIMNLINPTYAVQVGALSLPLNGVSHLSIVGNRAYLVGGKFFVVDISHPDAPKLLGSLAFPDNQANDLAIMDHYAIIADTEALRIVDIAEPARLKEVSSLQMAGWPYRVSVSGNFAYVVTNQTGLHVVNLANPAKPVEASFLPALYMKSVTVAGTLAWVSDDNIGLHALDVTDSRKPVEVEAYKTNVGSFNATVVGNYIYVVESSGGVAILRTNP